jgi:hypothetical protein
LGLRTPASVKRPPPLATSVPDWASLLGVSTILFLAVGLLAAAVGVAIPVMVRRGGVGAPGLFHPRPDAILFKPAAMDEASRRSLAVQSRILWDWLGGTLAAFGALQAFVAWFGLGEGQPWALWALSAGDLAMFPFWFLMLRPYAQAHARLRLLEVPPVVWVPALLVPPAVVLGWAGI